MVFRWSHYPDLDVLFKRLEEDLLLTFTSSNKKFYCYIYILYFHYPYFFSGLYIYDLFLNKILEHKTISFSTKEPNAISFAPHTI
jgi:hypothetical protein